MAIKSNVRHVGLFVDWNSQLRQTPKEYNADADARCRIALKSVGRSITKFLCHVEQNTIFRVRTRLYHGWTRKITQTENRKAVARCPEFDTPDDIFPSARVLSLGDIEFGDRLIDALPERENIGLGIHLPNTLRQQSGASKPNEKMVDTALASDLLSWARAEPSSLAIVMSEDDDVIPSIFTAECWMIPHGGRVVLSRKRIESESSFLRLDGIKL